MKHILLLLATVVLSSCTSVSSKECATMNWFKKGASDAKSGKPASMYGTYKEACLRHGISFDKEEYKDGYESELKD